MINFLFGARRFGCPGPWLAHTTRLALQPNLLSEGMQVRFIRRLCQGRRYRALSSMEYQLGTGVPRVDAGGLQRGLRSGALTGIITVLRNTGTYVYVQVAEFLLHGEFQGTSTSCS